MTRHRAIHGAIWWTELMTRDLPKALEYYGTMCGWAVDTMPDPDVGGPTLAARRWRHVSYCPKRWPARSPV